MSVIHLGVSSKSAVGLQTSPMLSGVAQVVGGESFKKIKDSLTGLIQGIQSGHVRVESMKHRIASGQRVGLQDVLLYQVRMGELGIKVELLSKLADSALASVRKLQGPQ